MWSSVRVLNILRPSGVILMKNLTHNGEPLSNLKFEIYNLPPKRRASPKRGGKSIRKLWMNKFENEGNAVGSINVNLYNFKPSKGGSWCKCIWLVNQWIWLPTLLVITHTEKESLGSTKIWRNSVCKSSTSLLTQRVASFTTVYQVGTTKVLTP